MRNSPTPSADAASAASTLAGEPTLASSCTRWPSEVDARCRRSRRATFACAATSATCSLGRVDREDARRAVDQHDRALGSRSSAFSTETIAGSPSDREQDGRVRGRAALERDDRDAQAGIEQRRVGGSEVTRHENERLGAHRNPGRLASQQLRRRGGCGCRARSATRSAMRPPCAVKACGEVVERDPDRELRRLAVGRARRPRAPRWSRDRSRAGRRPRGSRGTHPSRGAARARERRRDRHRGAHRSLAAASERSASGSGGARSRCIQSGRASAPRGRPHDRG